MKEEKTKHQDAGIFNVKKYNKSLQPPSMAKVQLLAVLRRIYYRAGILRENIARNKGEKWTKRRNLLSERLKITQKGIGHIEEALKVMYKMTDEDFELLKNYHYAKGDSKDGIVRLRRIEMVEDEQVEHTDK